MLQIKNTLGGGKPEGLYAWKKYEVIGTYRYSLKSSIVTCVVGKSSDKFTITLDSSNYDGDLSYLDVKNLCKWLDGSLGIVSNSKRQICSWNGGDYLTFAEHNDSSVTRYAYPSINNNIVTVTLYEFEDKSYTWNGLTKNTSFSSSIENAFEYYDYNYEYKGYIVSDKETAYPDGGEKDGYWYEKVSEGITPEMFGCTKMVVDTYTPTANIQMGSVTLIHSLGVIPRLLIIVADNQDSYIAESYHTTLKLAFVVNWNSSSYSNFYSGAVKSNTGAIQSDSTASANFTFTNRTIKSDANYSPGVYYLPAGETYKICTFA